MSYAVDYVGVDVSKQHLDLAIAGRRVFRVANTPAGMSRLIGRLARLERPHLVCEATGSYTRLLARELGSAPAPALSRRHRS